MLTAQIAEVAVEYASAKARQKDCPAERMTYRARHVPAFTAAADAGLTGSILSIAMRSAPRRVSMRRS
jgi:hypothetical protein